MISRNFTWLDDSVEHSDSDEARAKALAEKWSKLQTTRENRSFRSQADFESGYGPEPCEDCDACLAGDEDNCEFIKDCEREQVEKFEAEQVEIDIVEEMLERLGARMMRPYEHWNEDERYMEYMENCGEY